MSGARRWAAVLAVLGVACTSDPGVPERTYARADLPLIVLQPSDAPVGTTFVGGNSGYVGVDDLAEDEEEAAALRAAGFEDAYLAIFFDPRLYEPEDRLDPNASLALAYAMRFDSADGAAEGLGVVERDVRADADDLDDRPAERFGEDAFAVYGQLDPDEPPGFLFAWRAGNVVQVLIAAGARDAIREDAARTLAERMMAYARDPAAQRSPSPSPSPQASDSPAT